MRINKERMLKEFMAMVSIDSPSLGEKQMGEHIKERLNSLGFSVSEDDAGRRIGGNCGNVYGFLQGNLAGEPLLFCAHMDTVEPSVGKQAVIDKDGIIRSKGKTVLGADDCAGMAAILEALHAIKEQDLPHRSIEVLFTVAEELHCRGAAQFDFSKIKAKEVYVLDLGGPIGTAAYHAPKILSFTVTINGKSAHAGFAPQDGVHAIVAAAGAIGKLQIGRVDDETLLNVGIIEGGIATNIVPDRCLVKGEIRSYSHEKALEQAYLVKKHFETAAEMIGATIDFNTCTECEAYITRLDHPVIKRFEKACKEQGLPMVLEQTFGGSDNNHLAKHGIHGIVLACAMHQCHSCEEYTIAGELYRIAELTVSLMCATD